jgi:cation:H+ antiporter
MLYWAIFIFILSVIFLGVASSFIVDSLSAFAKKVGMSVFIIGSIILAVGTTIPEFSNMLLSNMNNVADIGVGTLIGAVVTNLCLTFGLVALISKSEKKIVKGLENDTYAFALIAIILFIFFSLDSLFSRVEGVVMAIIFVGYQIYLYRRGVTHHRKNIVFKKLSEYYIIIPFAAVLVIISSGMVIETGRTIAELFGVSSAVIGLVFISFGATVPELTSGIISAMRGKHELSFGNLFGASIVDLLMIPGLVSLIKPIKFNFSAFLYPLIIIVATLFFFISYINITKKIDKKLGVILISIYIIYLLVVLL